MNLKKKSAHSLFSPKLRGGVIGGTGYNFQDAYIVARLPRWLADPAFRSLIKEGFDDIDVVFDTGDGGSCTRHYQLKDHQVPLTEFREVVNGFAEHARRPGVNATFFVLGCCGLAPQVAKLWRQIVEFRGARKTHGDGALAATRAEIGTALVKHKLAAYEDLLLGSMEIDDEIGGLNSVDPRALRLRFRGAMMELPFYRNQSHEVIDRLFDRLTVRVNNAIRDGISREELEGLVRSELAAARRSEAVVVHLHGWVRQAYELPADAEIDWTQHFNHSTRQVPSPLVWEEELLPALQGLRRKFDADGSRRLIWLHSRAPLSAGLAFGHTFAEAAGYSIRVEQPTPGASEAVQYWETDTPIEGHEPLASTEVAGDPEAKDVLVAIGVTDDSRPRVEQYLAQASAKIRAALYLSPASGPSPTSVSARTAPAFAATVKREIRGLCNRHLPQTVHLFFFGPLGLAVLLGQKLNGLADIQCYEHVKTGGYAPSCRLHA